MKTETAYYKSDTCFQTLRFIQAEMLYIEILFIIFKCFTLSFSADLCVMSPFEVWLLSHLLQVRITEMIFKKIHTMKYINLNVCEQLKAQVVNRTLTAIIIKYRISNYTNQIVYIVNTIYQGGTF